MCPYICTGLQTNFLNYRLWLVGWGERKINSEVQVFSPRAPPKSFLLKMERKLKGENEAA